MLIGRLENPKLICQRELSHRETECEVIPLGVKKNISQQKFRIPFKNLSTSLDGDFDFTFVKVNTSTSNDKINELDDILATNDLTSLFEFYCQPGNMKFTPGQQQFLNVLIKVNIVKLAEIEKKMLQTTTSQAQGKALRRIFQKPVNKLLIARLKDTGVLFSFFVSLNLINP